jgi:DNA-binding beta-propeller fold protein YncE
MNTRRNVIMTAIMTLEGYVGTTGHVTDEAFKVITDELEKNCVVTNEDSNNLYGFKTEVVTTTYATKGINGPTYELWYQVKTPESPLGEGTDLAFGFFDHSGK